MANTEKMTKRMVIGTMLNDENISSNEVYVAYLTNELRILDNKNASRKKTAKQIENDGFKPIIIDILSNATEGMTATEIMRADETLNATSNQRVSALCKLLINDGIVRKTSEKGKTLFYIA